MEWDRNEILNKACEYIKEDEIVDKITDIWNDFILLEPQHPNELTDFQNAIHQLQYIMMAREARRSNPEKFQIIKGGNK